MRKRINPKERRRIPALIQIFGPLEGLGNCQTFLFCMIKKDVNQRKVTIQKRFKNSNCKFKKNSELRSESLFGQHAGG